MNNDTPQESPPDFIIRNALVFDGTGADPARCDVSVKDGVVAAMGPGLPGRAHVEIDADGLALMPGIIDSHTHFDAQITWDPWVRPSPSLGVTTAVIGNCGFTIAPCRGSDRELTLRNLTQVEGMSLEVLRNGVRWSFESFRDYLAALRAQGHAVNVAAYVGHSSVRTYVMGDDAPRRAANDAEVQRMAALVRDAMDAGAIGFASSTSPAHNGHGGQPMPSRLADEREFHALVGAMGARGRGTFMLTKGAETSMPFLESLAATSGRPVMIAALLHNSTNPDGVFADLDGIAAANARGHRLIGQVSCCPLTMEFTLASPYPVEGLPAWRPALGLEGDALHALLRAPAFRDAVRAELARPSAFRLFNGEWSKVHVVQAATERYAPLEQRSIADIARERGRDALDTMIDIALDEGLSTVFTAQLLNSDEEAVGRLINHPYALVSLSDAGAHLTFFNDAGFGLHLLGHWARDAGKLSMSQAVHQLTQRAAGALGIVGRGLIRAGHAADLLLFDPKTVGRGPTRRVHDLPGGAPRLHTDPIGVHGVWVNGVQVADAGGLKEEALAGQRLPGRLLTEFAG